MPDAYILRLRNGMEIKAASQQELHAKHVQHSYMAVSEGMCPARGIPLEPLPEGTVRTGYVAGGCPPCHGYHWANTGVPVEHLRVGWSRDLDPHTGEWITGGEWMA